MYSMDVESTDLCSTDAMYPEDERDCAGHRDTVLCVRTGPDREGRAVRLWLRAGEVAGMGRRAEGRAGCWGRKMDEMHVVPSVAY